MISPDVIYALTSICGYYIVSRDMFIAHIVRTIYFFFSNTPNRIAPLSPLQNLTNLIYLGSVCVCNGLYAHIY